MGRDTDIQWCDSTLNLQMGCDGCELWTPERRSCYAGQLTERYAGNNGWPASFEQPKTFLHRIEAAMRWPDLTGTKRPEKPWLDGLPRIVFLNDMGDTFTESLPLDWLDPIYNDLVRMKAIVMWLTKRPKRMAEYFKTRPVPDHFWLGTSVTGNSNRSRIKDLAAIHAKTLWISNEPAIESLDLRPWTEEGLECSCCSWIGCEEEANRVDEPADDWHFDCPRCGELCAHTPIDEQLGERLKLVIVGGESGSDARPFDLAWARQMKRACDASQAAFFMKQVGALPMSERVEPLPAVMEGYSPIPPQYHLLLRDSHGGDWGEWPRDLRVRDLPAPVRV